MKSKTGIILLILMFALALGAGMVAGKLSSRVPANEPRTVKEGTLTDALKLTPDQQTKMQDIWENVRKTANTCVDDAKRAQASQDDALMKILTEDQKAQYKKLTDETAGKIAALDVKRKESFGKAVEQTNAILDESQRKIYQQIVKDKVGELPDGAWPR